MSKSLIQRVSLSRSGWLLVLIAAAYGLVMGVVGSRLTFFAEDYDIFLNQSEAGLGVALLGNGGHWSPLSRLILLGETHLFGTWYPGYIAVNGFVLAVGLVALSDPVARSLRQHQWWVRVAFLQVALVPGVIAVILLASNFAWAFSLCLAGLAAVVATRRRWWSAGALTIASCLSMSGLGIFWALLSVGLSGAYVCARERQQLAAWRTFAIAASLSALGISIAGRVAASYWTSPYFAHYGLGDDSVIAVPSNNAVEAVGTWFILVATWSSASIWPAVMAVVDDSVARLAFVLVDYFVIAVFIWFAMIIGLLLALRRIRSLAWVSVLVITVAPALLWAAAISLLRGDQVHSERYVFVWLPSLVAFAWVCVVATARSASRNGTRWGTWAFLSLVLSSAVVLLATLPSTVQQAANIDRPRLLFSQTQVELAQQCAVGAPVKGLEEISPEPTQNHLCDLETYLGEVGLFD